MYASEVVLEQLRIDQKTRKPIDTRRVITKNWPFSIGVGRLDFQQYFCKNAKLSLSNCFGTGTLISEDTVLTCAHNVINRELKNDKRITNLGNKLSTFANSRGLTFTLNNEVVRVSSYFYDSDYLKDKEFDYALLKLEAPIEIDEDFLPFRNVSDKFLSSGSREYYVVGQNDDMLVYDCGSLCSFSDQTINYRISTNSGQSGGPVVTYVNPGWAIVGVHYSGIQHTNGNVTNSAVRINDEVEECIKEMIES